MDVDRLTAILSQRIEGDVDCDERSLKTVSTDFGRVVERRPRVVATPAGTEDIAAIVRTAREMRIAVSVRGAGHSQGGQALNQDGIVVQTDRLCDIASLRCSEGSVVAGAGATWHNVVRSTLHHGLRPYVLTDSFDVTVGGTLSVGGLGPASFRYGAQIDNCLGLEIVLGTGEVAWVDSHHQAQLFQHVLGGLGQFGIVTKAKLRLRSARPFVRHHYLTYDNIRSFLRDSQMLVSRERVELLSGAAVLRSHASRSTHDFVLIVSAESDDPTVDRDDRILEGTNPVVRSAESMSIQSHIERLVNKLDRFQRSDNCNDAHPWVEHFLPIASVPEYVEAAIRKFPGDPLLLWPMRTSALQQPMMRRPHTDTVVLVGILCWRNCSEVYQWLPQLRQMDELGVALNGHRYLSGWLDFDRDRWQQHFGPQRWEQITSLKHVCDPDNVFRLWDTEA